VLSARTLFLATFVAVTARGEEPARDAVRDQLRAKLTTSLPAPPSAIPVSDKKPSELPPIFSKPPPAREIQSPKPGEKKADDSALVVMAPVVVTESKRDLGLEKAIAGQEQKEPFSLVKGGTLYDNGRVQIGAWGTASGWTLLKIVW
jgi:hypothetical protein